MKVDFAPTRMFFKLHMFSECILRSPLSTESFKIVLSKQFQTHLCRAAGIPEQVFTCAQIVQDTRILSRVSFAAPRRSYVRTYNEYSRRGSLIGLRRKKRERERDREYRFSNEKRVARRGPQLETRWAFGSRRAPLIRLLTKSNHAVRLTCRCLWGKRITGSPPRLIDPDQLSFSLRAVLFLPCSLSAWESIFFLMITSVVQTLRVVDWRFRQNFANIYKYK